MANCRILIVEDEYLLADDLRQALERAGALIVGPAPDVAAALDLIQTEADVDGAVLDVNLGGETSYPVADALLARDVPFMFATGYDPDSLPERYSQVACCEKPVEVAAICSTLGRLVHA